MGRPLRGLCLIWQGARSAMGYGQIRVGKKTRATHRVAYSLVTGIDLDSIDELDHLCRVRLCFQPLHMEQVTHHENVRRGDLWTVHGLKTRCRRGHPYDSENTYQYPDGRRSCRTCATESSRAYDARNPDRAKRPWGKAHRQIPPKM